MRIFSYIFTFILLSTTGFTSEKQSFDVFIAGVKVDVVAQGVNPTLFDQLFATVEPVESVYSKLNNQPEVKFSFSKYTNRLISDTRVATGRKKFAEYNDDLQNASATYGVPPEVITALWGIETNFGAIRGSYDLLNSLSTLAWDSRRKDFFRKELLAAITILAEGHTTRATLQGSWAGATGQCQFMPTSFIMYAQDGNGDGKKDIWGTEADVFASAANYLKQRGWQKGQPWGFRVILGEYLPKGLTFNGRKLTKSKPLSYWQDIGVYSAKSHNMKDLPASTQAKLFLPDGPSGRAWLVLNNFDVIMKWNNSSSFAYSVLTLAEKIKPEA